MSRIARVLVPVLVGSVFSTVLVSTPVATAVEPPPALADTADPVATKVAERPDAVSAMVAAQAQASRVEDLSQRTESTRTFANPDGTWSTEMATGPERVQREDGSWVDIDTTLVRDGAGAWVPQAAAAEVSFSDGGAEPFATMAPTDGSSFGLTWPEALPEPVVNGSTLTYPEVVSGGDLVVEALPGGFSHQIVLHQAPAQPVDYQIPLELDGLSLVEQANGAISVQTDGGQEVASAPAPLMWDQEDGPGGEPETVAPLTTTVDGTGADAELVLTPDMQVLQDPATQYPVTIDPTFSHTPFRDVWVQNADYTNGQVGSPELRAGTYDGGAHKARSFVDFDTTTLTGKHILSATLKLRNFYSGSCNSANIRANAISDTWNKDTLTWANQPDVYSGSFDDYATAYGATGCPDAGWAQWNVIDMVRNWTDGTWTNRGIRLKAIDETNNASWRKYRSANWSDSNVRPRLIVDYNSSPGTPAAPTLTPVSSYAPPGSTTSTLFTADTTPKFTSTGSDPDNGKVKLEYEVHDSKSTSSSTLRASCTTAMVAAGSSSSCSPSITLADNATYYVRTHASDGKSWGAWSGWTSFKMAATTPQRPVVTCPGHTDGSWADAAPTANVVCTVSAEGSTTGAAGYIRVSVDGGTEKRVHITQSPDSAVAQTTVSVYKTAGAHKIVAKAESPAGLTSPARTYQFGYGPTGLTYPATSPMVTTTGAVRIDAAGPPRGSSPVPTAKVQWRIANSGKGETQGWNDAADATLQVTDNGAAGVAVGGTWNTAAEVRDVAAGTDLDTRVPVVLELQVCLAYSSGTQCTWSQQPAQVLRVPHAFGDDFPVVDAGPGQVALWTGEFNTQETDIEVPGYTGTLSISRSHSTFAGEPSPATGVFGPGWTAQVDGAAAGMAGLQIVDNTRLDGTIVLIDADGSVAVFATPTGVRRTNQDLPTGIYQAVGDATESMGVRAAVSGTGSATELILTDPAGIKTTFGVAAPPTTGTDAVFIPRTVDEPGQVGATTFSWDDGRISRILAPVPPGVTCPATGGLNAGCRALRLEYATTTTAAVGVPGDVMGQIKAVWLEIYNPTTKAMSETKVAAYLYDSEERLVQVVDPRSQLRTNYSYDGSTNRLETINPAGQTPYELDYVTAPSVKLAAVKRARPSSDPNGGTAVLASFVYDVPTSSNDLPDLSDGSVAAWAQEAGPTYGAAVFGPDHPVSATTPDGIAAGDWKYAELWYADERGYTVNTASHGAGSWLITHTGYDDQGNSVRELSASEIAAIRAGDLAPNDAGVLAVYNDEIVGPEGEVLLPAGSVVTDLYGPARWATLEGGTNAWVRPHTHTDFDEGAPNGGVNPDTGTAYGLPTSAKVAAFDPGTGLDVETASASRTGYAAINPGDTSGWDLGLATSTTRIMGAGQPDITRVTRYDSEGKPIESRQPKSSGSDVGSRHTVYYTATTNTLFPNCGEQPQWAGLVCRIYAGAAPSAGPDIPTTVTTGYSMLLDPTTIVETSSAGVERTTRRAYLADGRLDWTHTQVTGLASSTALPGSKLDYDPNSGMPTAITPIDADGNRVGDPESTQYDSWGRVVSYTPLPGETTTSSYDAAGRIATVASPTGTTSWSYENTDALGRSEYRGLPTKLTVSNPGGSPVTFAGAYNADGELELQRMPGGITQEMHFDTAGEATGLTYSGQLSVTDDDGSTTTARGEWLGWSLENDILGRVRREWTPSGAAFTDPGVGHASGYDRAYSYDRAGRLAEVTDRTAPTGQVVSPSDPAASDAPCETRIYQFDANGNRTGLIRRDANADGSCATTGGSMTTWSYDSADRLTNGANGTGTYTYDALGRTTSIPAVDTPAGSFAGDLQIAYYDTDEARAVTQNGHTTTYELDVLGRRATATESTPTGGATSETVHHYVDTSDRPAWVEITHGTTTTITRFATSLGGDLAATITDNGVVQLPIISPHGDAVTTVTVPTSGTATGVGPWVDYDEYGNPGAAGETVTTDGSYGWLGGKQRATELSGMLLMGARLYNPVTGQFTSVDPEYGGNETDYNYPTDPVNIYDLDGLWSFGGIAKWVWKHRVAVAGIGAAGACILATAGACAVVSGIAAGLSIHSNYRKFRRGNLSGRGLLANTALDLVLTRFKAIRYVGQLEPRHRLKKRVIYRAWRKLHHDNARQAFRRQPAQSTFRLLVQTYSAWRASTGRNRPGIQR
jgi:large repetitive protein